ncbi:MAG: peptide deformylase [Elusimicrobia bacterium]|nr:peptide deformylase [Elusimicrobiota bacterium]
MDHAIPKNLPALLPIVKYGHPVLVKKAKPVATVNEAVLRLIPVMFNTMYAEPGIGLAAPQVGISLRIMVVDVGPDGKSQPLALINPRIDARKGHIKSEEGCLSFPGIQVTVPRAAYVKLSAINEKGFPITVEAEGLLSRCLQHELDHLDGVVMIDHLSMPQRLKTLWDIRQRKKDGLW